MLTGWKAVSTFLDVSPRTAKKYAAKHGMPIRRLPGGMVTILSSDLIAWIEHRKKKRGVS